MPLFTAFQVTNGKLFQTSKEMRLTKAEKMETGNKYKLYSTGNIS